MNFVSSNKPVLEADVLVVGGGPVGAALTGDLGSRGIRALMVEATDGVFRDARMHLVNIRSMEFIRRWGLENQVRSSGWPAEHSQDVVYATSLSGIEIARIPWPAIACTLPPSQSPTFAQRCPQSWFNPIMLEFAGSHACTRLLMEHSFEAFDESRDGVVATVRNTRTDEIQQIKAKYLVGCDGSRSQVRRSIGIDRKGSETYGRSAEVIFRSARLKEINRLGRAGRFTMITGRGKSSSLLPFDGNDLYRLTLMVQEAEVTLDDFNQAIRALCPDVDFPFEIITPVLPWINRDVSAERYRVGRVFLAGDAAHSMPPTGGFGMNTGLVDAFELGWRLQAVLKGWGGNTLLDSYDIERREAVARTTRMAVGIYKDWIEIGARLRGLGDVIEELSPAGAACRARLRAELIETFTREFNPLGAALGYRFTKSPICLADDSAPPEDTMIEYEQTNRAGHRAPHVWLADGRSTLDLFGKGFVLIDRARRSGSRAPILQAARARNVPISVHEDASGALDGLYDTELTLVRPDGFVAWRGDAVDDAEFLMDVVRGAEHALALEQEAR